MQRDLVVFTIHATYELTYSAVVPDFNACEAFTRNSSGDSSNPLINVGTCFAGPYEDNGHTGLSPSCLRSFVIVSTLQREK